MAFFVYLVYVFFLLVRPQEFIQPMLGLPLVKLSLGSAAILMLFGARQSNRTPFIFLLSSIALVALVSGFLNGWLGGGINAFLTVLTAMLLPFAVAQQTLLTLGKQRLLMWVLLFSGLVMVSNGISQLNSDDGVGWAGVGLLEGSRITYLGIFNDPNDLGMFFVMLLPVAIYSASEKVWYRIAAIGAIPMLLYGIYLTNSRGALLGVMSMAGLWFYLRFGVRKSVVLGLLLLPIALLVIGQFRSIDAGEASAAGRLDAWYEGIQLFLWKPRFGVGFGNFTEYHFLTAHNSFVLVFSELGIVGYFLWVSFVSTCAFGLLRVWNPKGKNLSAGVVVESERRVAQAMMYSLIGYLVTSFFLSRAYTSILYVFCGMYAATYLRATYNEKKDDYLKVGKNFSKLLNITLVSILLIYTVTKVFL